MHVVFLCSRLASLPDACQIVGGPFAVARLGGRGLVVVASRRTMAGERGLGTLVALLGQAARYAQFMPKWIEQWKLNGFRLEQARARDGLRSFRNASPGQTERPTVQLAPREAPREQDGRPVRVGFANIARLEPSVCRGTTKVLSCSRRRISHRRQWPLQEESAPWRVLRKRARV